MPKVTKAKERSLPKTVYVYWYEDSDDPWLSVSEGIDECAEVGGRLVGIYKLTEIQSVSLVTKSEVVTKKGK